MKREKMRKSNGNCCIFEFYWFCRISYHGNVGNVDLQLPQQMVVNIWPYVQIRRQDRRKKGR